MKHATAISASAPVGTSSRKPSAKQERHKRKRSWGASFSEVACETARLAGKPLTFLVAVTLVVIWALSGSLFHYSDTWQLVINTSTTIVTFLMVFLLQHTQNRDTLALQLKLAEVIISLRHAENRVATIEDLSEDELEHLHEEYRQRADEALDHLSRRRGTDQRAS
jgi:low affinity Fe/Cu permease